MADYSGLDMLNYSFADADASGCDDQLIAEQALWCAVINQAFTDAINGKRLAIEWLLHERKDFVFVCSLAGVSPFAVRTAARRLTTSRRK